MFKVLDLVHEKIAFAKFKSCLLDYWADGIHMIKMILLALAEDDYIIKINQAQLSSVWR